jgi:hypothetical protein
MDGGKVLDDAFDRGMRPGKFYKRDCQGRGSPMAAQTWYLPLRLAQMLKRESRLKFVLSPGNKTLQHLVGYDAPACMLLTALGDIPDENSTSHSRTVSAFLNLFQGRPEEYQCGPFRQVVRPSRLS